MDAKAARGSERPADNKDIRAIMSKINGNRYPNINARYPKDLFMVS